MGNILNNLNLPEMRTLFTSSGAATAVGMAACFMVSAPLATVESGRVNPMWDTMFAYYNYSKGGSSFLGLRSGTFCSNMQMMCTQKLVSNGPFM
jgi:hypothetical protein